MYVCVCVPFTEDEVKKELKTKTLDELMDETDIGTVCGSCYDYLKEFENNTEA